MCEGLPVFIHQNMEPPGDISQEGRTNDLTSSTDNHDGYRDEWRTMPFSQAAVINPRLRLDRGETYPFVSMAAVDPNSHWVYADDQREYSSGGARFQDGDTLMARITPCLENGKIARYRSTNGSDDAYGSTEFIVIRGRAEVTDNRFAYYLTRSPAIRNYAINQMTGTSGRQRVPTSALDHIDVLIPPLSEQRRIAHILGTLDEKIELNRRMNATLESMARALFKSWFVDFEPVRAKMEGRWCRGESLKGMPAELHDLFPERLVPSSLGEVPEGWDIGTLGDIADSHRRGISPTEVEGEIPYIGLQHMPRRSIALTEWANAEEVTSAKSIFKKGEFLFGKLRPYFHKVGIAAVDGVCSTDIVVLMPKRSDWSAFLLCYISSNEFVAYTDQTSTGTRMPRTSWQAMKQYRVCLPPQKLSSAFQKLMQPKLEQIIDSCHESRSLGGLRDVLLPKLVPGELQVGH